MNTSTRKPANKTKKTKKTLGTIFAIIFAFVLVSVFSGCAPSASAKLANTDEPESVISALRDADKIVAKKKVMSFGDQWTITADGEEIGTIRGEAIYLTGDTYTLSSNSGKVVSIEDEGFRIVNHTAKLYDHNSEPTGSIKENLSVMFQEYEILDENGTLKGTAKQKMSASMRFEIKGTSDSVDYIISKSFLSVGSKVTIERKNVDSSVSALDALWMAVIASEVDDANKDNQ